MTVLALGPRAEAFAPDRRGRWPGESIEVLGESGLLGLTVPVAMGGAGEGPRTFAAVTHLLAEQCASTAMIYLMHVCATQVFIHSKTFAARDSVLRAIASGRHLSTLAFSEQHACVLAAFAEELRRARRKPTTICSRSKSNAIET